MRRRQAARQATALLAALLGLAIAHIIFSRQDRPQFIVTAVLAACAISAALTVEWRIAANRQRIIAQRTGKTILIQAATHVITTQTARAGHLMQRLDIDFIHATRLIDELHRLHIIGPPNGSEGREVRYLPGRLDDAIDLIQKEN